MKKCLPLAVLLCSFSAINAQIDPTVTGDTMLCPQGTGTLTTETYDSYQWLRRYYGSTTTEAISGATAQTLVMDYYDYAASYISVVVTDGADTDTSAETFVDGWVFASPTVSTSGSFTIGPNGEAILCTGDTLFLEFMSPYVTNITWFDGGNAIAGETASVLEVTSAGSYTVQGSPEECPDYIAMQGIPVDVIMDNCGLGLDEATTAQSLIYPNPATETITIEGSETILSVSIANSAGQTIAQHEVMATLRSLDISKLDAGIYFMTVSYQDGLEIKQFSIR